MSNFMLSFLMHTMQTQNNNNNCCSRSIDELLFHLIVLPPSSTSTTNYSSKGNYMSIIVAVSGSVGVIALVAIMIATAFSLKRRKTTVNRKK